MVKVLVDVSCARVVVMLLVEVSCAPAAVERAIAVKTHQGRKRADLTRAVTGFPPEIRIGFTR